jgi:hypothetical protein
VAARRFGLRQGAKIRPIDNFAEFMVNDAFGSKEKVTMLGVDHIVSWARAWITSVDDSGWFQICDDLGGVWSGRLHSSWTLDSWRDLMGRVTDLKNAYKQVAAHPAHASFGIIAVQDPQDSVVKLFRAFSLMFGGTAAVYSFLRISRAISTLASRLLHLVVVEFFDDFTQLETRSSAQSAMDAMEDLMNILGWRVSMSETKRFPFQKEVVTLGQCFIVGASG